MATQVADFSDARGGTMAATSVSGPGTAAAPDVGHGDHAGRAPASGSGSASFSNAYAQALARTAPDAGVAPSVRGPPAQRGHLPVGIAGHDGGHDLHQRALALRAKRLELLASNISNADTPGYKAVDIDVVEALRTGQSAATATVKYRVPLQMSLDGNTVEMEVERAQFADAAIRYQFSLEQAIRHYMHISDLFKNLKD